MGNLKNSYVTLIFLFFYCPLGVLILFSFNDTTYSALWQGFTWRWYALLLNDHTLIQVTTHSLILSLLASTIATAIGTYTSVALFRFRFAGKRFLEGLLFTLIMLPDIVVGISLLLLFSFIHLKTGFLTLLLAHITFCIPFAVVTIYSRITGMDKHLFEAAKDLGANDFTILTKIVIPLLLPAIVASWLLSFTLSIDDVIISFFVSGPQFQILPLQIYSMIRLGITPEINALCSIIFAITLLLVTLAAFMLRKKPGRPA